MLRVRLLASALALFVMVAAFPAVAQDKPFLVKNGKSPYQIVLNVGASPSEEQAAKELQHYFKACTGAKLPIVIEAPNDGTPMIVLGCGPASVRLLVDRKAKEVGKQAYIMRSVSPHLVIAGSPEGGTLYGVYDFLEKYLGVRWYAPGVTKTPEVKELALPEVDVLVRPAFKWRNTTYRWEGKDAEFLSHMRDNNGGGGPDHPFGAQEAHDGRCHTYFRFISPGEFFDEHPEYFSEIGGVRQRHETQLCLTNPEVLEIVTQRMLKRMADNPGYAQYNFSQLDYYNYCHCDKCTAMNEKYGTTGGTQFWFVNELAKRTAEVYPDKVIGTLAYTYTEEPPQDMVMHPNVAVWLCHMFPCCDSHPIATCPYNADYKRRAEAWSKICNHLYIWHYIVDFAHYYNPFPNFGAMAEDMKFYRDICAEGVFLQGMGHGGGGGEFSLLRPYYGMKLLKDPDQDPDALIRDFLQGYYADAWEPIYTYIKMLQTKVDEDDIHMHLYTNPAMGYLTDEILDKADALFDQAEDAVKDDEVLLERVKVARMPLTYARSFPRNGYTIANGMLRFNPPFAPLTDVQAMYDRMKAHGFQTLREKQGPPEQLMQLSLLFNMPLPAPSIQNEHLSVDVIPILGARALRITHKASGQCITSYNTNRSLYFPFCGGEETRICGIFWPQGMFDQFNITAKTDNAITLTARVAGFDLTRQIALAPDAPELTITSTVVNASGKPQESQIRSHTNFDLGDLYKTRLSFTNREGEAVERPMEPIIAGLREGEHYLDEKAPKGAWTFTGTKGLKVTQTFDEAQLDFTWAYAYPDYLNDLEVEVWSKPVDLGPGESTSFATTFRIEPVK